MARRRVEIGYPPPVQEDETCPLCGRTIPPSQRELHHLVPKARGGRETQALHRICHRQIHALFSEKELEQLYPTPADLLAHPDIQAFVQWIRTKPPDYRGRAHMSGRRKEMR